jgi:hypothetical protein
LGIVQIFFSGLLKPFPPGFCVDPLQPSPNREEKAQKFAPSYYGDATAQSLDIGLWHGGVNSNSFRVVELVYLMTQRQ